ncbi:Shikimate dehydrogenase [Mycena floridula]|nr:Shikimate dehydrogenase [Mycena floridula]
MALSSPPKDPSITLIPILGQPTIHIGQSLLGSPSSSVESPSSEQSKGPDTSYIATKTLALAPSDTYILIADERVWGIWGERLGRAFEGVGVRVQKGISAKPTDSSRGAGSTTNATTGAKDTTGAAKGDEEKEKGDEGKEKEEKEAKARLIPLLHPPGEPSKSRVQKARLEDLMFLHGCTRSTVILALGGGVTGDLAGFVAATFMRGVRYIQIPTTLLSMVDSAIGGKTAIDIEIRVPGKGVHVGKNLVGAFWQPTLVFVDTAFLGTLPRREWANGLAEVVKTAAIWDPEAFETLERLGDAVLPCSSSGSVSKSDPTSLVLPLVISSIGVKAHIVTIDPTEKGLRNLVNFGHTIGHAVEGLLAPALLHGECVSVGMILEAELARQLGHLGQVTIARLGRVLKGLGLPVTVGEAVKIWEGWVKAQPTPVPTPNLSPKTLLSLMSLDKKNVGALKKVVLLTEIGKTLEMKATGVSDAELETVLSDGVTVGSSFERGSSLGSLEGSNLGPLGEEVAPSFTITPPGSKSISNRALVLAALGNGTCRLKNLLHSDDTAVMIGALRDFGAASFEWEDGGETLVVKGGGRLVSPVLGDKVPKPIYLGNAGTAARFLTALSSLAEGDTVLTGNARMKQRPIGPLVEALRGNGVEVAYLDPQREEIKSSTETGCLPLLISSSTLRGGTIKLDATISSQYVSAILMCAPYAEREVRLDLSEGEGVISKSYVDMTVKMMSKFGCVVREQGSIYTIPLTPYTNPAVYTVEPDASSATYPLAIAAIMDKGCYIPGITIGSSSKGSMQGDALFARDVIAKMGVDVEWGVDGVRVRPASRTPEAVGARTLKALGTIDMEHLTDAFLTACVLAAVADGKTEITGIANQRVKECDRINAMSVQLSKFGVETIEKPGGIIVEGRGVEAIRKYVGERYGTGNYPAPLRVHCYDDHRVAMAFAVLACIIPNVVIEERRCVEKTWPGWWDDLSGKIGIPVRGVDVAALDAQFGKAHQSDSKSESNADAESGPTSILIIGMRGSGKTHIGSLAASTSDDSFKFIDADFHFTQTLSTTPREFVAQWGWERFREEETKILGGFIGNSESRYSHIISLGGGIVEHPAARALLKEYMAQGGRVVHVNREIREVVGYLTKPAAETDATTTKTADADADTLPTAGRPAYGEPITKVYERRKPWFEECSNCEFWNWTGGDPVQTKDAVQRFFSVIAAQTDTPRRTLEFVDKVEVEFGGARYLSTASLIARSYVLDLPLQDLIQISERIEELVEGVDAVRVWGSLLSSGNSASAQIAALRRACPVPIIFVAQDRESAKVAGRCGVEWVEIGEDNQGEDNEQETERPVESIAASRVGSIPAYHPPLTTRSSLRASLNLLPGTFLIITLTTNDWSSQHLVVRYEKAAELGDIVKIVGLESGIEQDLACEAFKAKIAHFGRPLIAYNLGPGLSMVLNRVFTPVGHAGLSQFTLGSSLANLGLAPIPSLLPISAHTRSLRLLGSNGISPKSHGISPKLDFYLLGSGISHSMSPRLHNGVFGVLGFGEGANSKSGWNYSLYDTPSLSSTANDSSSSIASLLTSPTFGGSSVTIPHKIDIMQYVDVVEEGARRVGAVNTVFPVWRVDALDNNGTENPRRILYATNTDVQGIFNAVTKYIALSEIRGVLVIGAGGTARAAVWAFGKAKIPLYIYNATPSNARRIAESEGFKHLDVTVLERLGGFGNGSESLSTTKGAGNKGADEKEIIVNVIIGTVPGDVQVIAGDHSSADVANVSRPDAAKSGSRPPLPLPPSVFAYTAGPAVVLDMAYKPRVTRLLELGGRVNRERADSGIPDSLQSSLIGQKSSLIGQNKTGEIKTGPAGTVEHTLEVSNKLNGANWTLVQGIDALVEQGIVQSEMWTGRRFPSAVGEAVRASF